MCVRFELYNTPKIVKFLKGVKYTLDKPKDIRPGDSAPVIAMDKNLKPRVFVMKWGYNLNGKLVFNSRNEDIINRKMFKQDFISHRLAIPATSYYEWDKEKTKYKLSTNDELMYFAGIYHYENNQFVFESIMYSAITLYTNGGASRTRLAESHKRWEAMLESKKEEKLTRTQELNTAKIRALRELGYDEIDKSNASEVLDKIAEIMAQKF